MDISEQARADIERLNDTIRRAQETIDRATKERDDIAIFLRLHERYAAKEASKNAVAAIVGVGALSGVGMVSVHSKSEGVRVAVREMLAVAGERLTINEIYEKLVALNIEIGGEQPKANLANILSRAKNLFEYRNPEGWWLVGVPESNATGQVSLLTLDGSGGRKPPDPFFDVGDHSPTNA